MELLEQISIKLNYLTDAVGYLGVSGRAPTINTDIIPGGVRINTDLKKIESTLKKLEQDFHLSAAPLYMAEIPSEIQDSDVGRMLDKISFADRSKEIIHALMTHAAAAGPISGSVSIETNAAMRLLSAAQNMGVHTAFQPMGRDTCKCGADYIIIPEISVRQCPGCSKVKTISGICFGDARMTDPYGAKNKNRSAVMRHYLFWMNRIQAREKVFFDDKLITNIRYVMQRDGDVPQDLKCERVREILKDPVVACPKLNDHVPSLIVKLGGPAPPQLTADESERHRVLFIKIIDLYDHRGNKPYYPYFIYKLIEIMFSPRPVNAVWPSSSSRLHLEERSRLHREELREELDLEETEIQPDSRGQHPAGPTQNHTVCLAKLALLDYIHLQNPETVIRRDAEFEKIVKKSDPLDGLYYVPTNLCMR